MLLNKEILTIEPGWTTEAELQWLCNSVALLPDDALIVEIGCWQGRSTAALCQGAINIKRVVTIDNFTGSVDINDPIYSEAKACDIKKQFEYNMCRLGYNPELLEMPSIKASKYFQDETVDFIFIDGDHYHLGDDLDAWCPKIKHNGVISGHDYFCFYQTIQQEIHKRFYIHGVVNSIWWRIKDEWF